MFAKKPSEVPQKIIDAWLKFGPFDIEKAIKLTKLKLDISIPFEKNNANCVDTID